MSNSILLVFALNIYVAGGAHWSYDTHHGGSGPRLWKNKYPDCGKASQSPIDILPEDAEFSDMPEFRFRGHNDTSSSRYSYLLVNNGHTAQLGITRGEMVLSGGDLPEGDSEFVLAQLHFHWGGINKHGSEHTVRGQSYPMEIHFVHFDNGKYSTISEAVSAKDGLAVLGVFVEVGDKAHPTFDKLTEKFCSIKYSGMNTTKIDNVQILSMFPNNRRHFVRYSGSLTTPGCQESVVWTVFRDPISISQSQLNAFRALSHNGRKDGHDTPMEDNFRPVQPIGERTVLRNFDAIKPIQVVQFEQTFEEVEKTNSGQHITTSRLAVLTVLVTFIASLHPSHF